jgi:hypothetical protein
MWRRAAPGPAGTLLLDLISAPATNAYSVYRKLRSGYAGSAFRVRRSSDNAEQDIGFAGDYVDTAALLAFVGAGSGYVVTLYDQSGNGRELIQSTLASQPRIVNAGVLDAFPSGRIAMSFDGTDDRLQRNVAGNTAGMTGNPNITMGSAFQITNTAVSCVPCGFGNALAATGTTCVLHRSIAFPGSIKKQHGNTDRNWTLNTAVNTAGHAYVLQHTAGGNVHSGSVRQNGAALVQGGTTGSVVALNLIDDSLNLGANVTGSVIMTGKLNCFLLFNAVLAGADLTALETELALHTTAPVTYALDQISVPALCAVSSCRKLRSAYSGPCLRVRRSSDSTEQDIGFAGNVLDQAALLAFVGAGSGYVVTLYDQGPAGRHLTQTDTAKQPLIVNAGVLVITTGTGSLGVPTMKLDTGRGVERADACGMTGAPALTMATRFRSTNTSGSPVYCRIGSAASVASAVWQILPAGASPNQLYLGYVNGPCFNVNFWNDLRSDYYVARAAAGEANQLHAMRVSGVDSGLNSVAGNGALLLVLTDGVTALGGTGASGAAPCVGDANVMMVFNAELTGADLTALDAELQAHR